MLTKSKSSALILSGIWLLSYVIASLVFQVWVPYWLTGVMPDLFSEPPGMAGPSYLLRFWGAVLLVLGFQILIGGFCIYRFLGDGYYGRRGIIFWVLFAVLLATMFNLPRILLEERWAMQQRCWRMASVFPAFFLARWICGIKPAATPRPIGTDQA